MEITKQTLSEFWKDNDAPPGNVYFLDNKLFAQLHYFDKCFTVFFHVEPKLNNIIADFQRIKQSIINFFDIIISNNAKVLYNPYLIAPRYSPRIESVRFTEGIRDRHILHHFPLNKDNLKEMENKIRECHIHTLSLTEISFELKNTYLDRDNQSITINYWNHTATSDYPDKEEGFTIHFEDYSTQAHLISETVKLISSKMFLEQWGFLYDATQEVQNYYSKLA